MQPQALPGFRDFYPADLALRDHIVRTWRQVAARYGFEEYDGPPLEPLELYTAKSGEEIVGQLYSFTDKGGREVALRPEMTPTLARMVAARANGLKKPIRWFSIPQLFRYERQQRGRLREHFQLNCDLIGEKRPLADAEVVALATDTMRAFGFESGDIRVRLSDRKILASFLKVMQIPEEKIPAAYQVIDKMVRVSPNETIEALARAGLPDDIFTYVASLDKTKTWTDFDRLFKNVPEVREASGHLRVVMKALADMGLADFIDLDLTIVRGLAYYTGPVFEIFDASRKFRAICGGGRYDNLLQALGGVDLPALGFGMGDVVLGELLRERGLAPEAAASIDVFLAAITQDDLPHVLGLARELRDAGLRVEYALAPQAVGKQLSLADARSARLAVVVGPDDRARGEVMVKDLRGKTQESVRREAVRDRVIAGVRSPVTA